MKSSEQEVMLNKGEMIAMPANKPHTVKTITRMKMMLALAKELKL